MKLAPVETLEPFASLPQLVAKASMDDLPAILGALEAARVTACARLAAPWYTPRPAVACEEDRLLDFAEAGQILGIAEDRARDLGRASELPVVRIGKYRRVRLSAVRAYIEAHETPANTRRKASR